MKTNRSVVVLLSCLATSGCIHSSEGTPGERAVTEIERVCENKWYTNGEKVERLRTTLKSFGAEAIDDLLNYAKGEDPTMCRALAIGGLYDAVDRDPILIRRFLHGLRPVATRLELTRFR